MHGKKRIALFGALALCFAVSAFAVPKVKPIPRPEPDPVVGIGRGSDWESVTRQAIANAGGLDKIVKKGDIVLIKPNLCVSPAAGDAKTTDYRVVKAIAEVVKGLGASRVIIAEGGFSGNAFSKAELALNKYDTIPGVEFLDINAVDKQDSYELTPPKSLIGGKRLFIPKAYMDADVVITAAKLKTHKLPEAVISLSLKNAFGVPAGKVYGGYGYKAGLHNFPLSETILEINKIRLPDFAVIDGIVGGEGYGPANNTPVKSEVVFAGKDLVAVDTAALTFMGFDVAKVPHVALAAKEELGVGDLSRIKVVGADLAAIKMDFKSMFKR